jgi:hypothetical protein
MMSMNCSPPWARVAARADALPAVKALMRNRLSWIIGAATLVSIMTNTASSTVPPASRPKTAGFAHPIVCPP